MIAVCDPAWNTICPLMGARFELPELCQAAQRSQRWNTCWEKAGVSEDQSLSLLPFTLS